MIVPAAITDRIAELAQVRMRMSEVTAELNGPLLGTLTADWAATDRLALADTLYWHTPLINATTIARELLHCRVHELPGRLPPHFACHHCQAPLPKVSRSAVAAHAAISLWVPTALWLCADCTAQAHAAAAQRHADDTAHHAARLRELQTMPYAAYLQTEEWRARRLEELRRAHFRCRLCNAAGPLDVHHRTYERRGCEAPADLIVLCRVCHTRFHRPSAQSEHHTRADAGRERNGRCEAQASEAYGDAPVVAVGAEVHETSTPGVTGGAR